MLKFPVGLINKENVSFATLTLLLLRPCSEDIVLCLDLSVSVARVGQCTLGNRAESCKKREDVLWLRCICFSTEHACFF